MLHALATPVNAHTAALWGALKVCHVDNDTYCRCPRQDELLTRSASRWGLSMWIFILKTHGGAGAGGQNGHSNHNHALFIERAHAAPRGESAVERETADLTPTNTFTQAAPRSNITCSHRMTNAVLTATIRAGICHLDHRPYPGESSGGGAAGVCGPPWLLQRPAPRQPQTPPLSRSDLQVDGTGHPHDSGDRVRQSHLAQVVLQPRNGARNGPRPGHTAAAAAQPAPTLILCSAAAAARLLAARTTSTHHEAPAAALRMPTAPRARSKRSTASTTSVKGKPAEKHQPDGATPASIRAQVSGPPRR